ncbi:MAG: cytochrome c biogenesis protein ResB [Gammaproteobacteria bacterium]|nr:cytochrome c biogenesis protein ResB [Gammaproteobacteria bacterium]
MAIDDSRLTPPATPQQGPLARLIHLLSSMPVAVFLLCTVALASMIGTILVQNREEDFYIANLGPTWYKILDALDFFNMYDSWWFLAIMTLLVLSVSAALLRHGPRFWHMSRPLRVMRPWPKKSDGGFSLTSPLASDPDATKALLRRLGFSEFQRGEEHGRPLLLARQGRFSKYGFFLVHGGVVLICVGGLITSQLGFRGVMNLPEQESDNRIYVSEGSSYRTLQLPFLVRNDDFDISFYKSGMPSEYSSQLTLHRDGQDILSKRITVNDPLRYQGVTFYQASFGDAGSAVEFAIRDLTSKGFPEQKIKSEVHKELEDGMGLKLTIKELRQHNVMNMAQEEGKSELRDVGPSLDIHFSSPSSGNITYRIYMSYPHMLAFGRTGDREMTYDDLGFNPADSVKMELLAAYLDELSKVEGERGPDQNRAAFAAAMTAMGLPLSRAAELGPAIANAEQVLRRHKLPMLFSFSGFEPKMYTGLQVARDPGSPLVWSACALLVIGLYMMIYMHEKRVWIRFDRERQQLEVCAVLSGKDKHPVNTTLERLRRELAAAPPIPSGK